MKIYLSPKIRKTYCFFACLFLFCVLLIIYWFLNFGFDLIMLSWILFLVSICSLILYNFRILLTIISVESNMFRSILFNKELCCVDLSKTVYYSVFEFQCGLFEPIEKYIIISNEEIKLKNKKLENRVMFRFYTDKQIVIPYNDKTRYLFRNKKWIYQNIKQ